MKRTADLAAMVEPFSEEYNTHAAFKKIPLDALKKLPSPMNLICVTPTRIDALFSDFKKDGYSIRQVLQASEIAKTIILVVNGKADVTVLFQSDELSPAFREHPELAVIKLR